MAANTPSAGSGGSRGIAGGRNRVRKSRYAAAESSLGRSVSPPGMHAELIGDNGLDNDWVLSRNGAIAVIRPKADRKTNIPCDFDIDRWRHLIEILFCDLKQWRGIATLYDKIAPSFAAMINSPRPPWR